MVRYNALAASAWQHGNEGLGSREEKVFPYWLTLVSGLYMIGPWRFWQGSKWMVPITRPNRCSTLEERKNYFLLISRLLPIPYLLSWRHVSGLFGNPFATSWTFILCSLVFQLPVYKGYRSSVVTFTKGQPLGFLSSWPLFTLTHHMLVWIAAVWHDEALRLCHSWRRWSPTRRWRPLTIKKSFSYNYI